MTEHCIHGIVNAQGSWCAECELHMQKAMADGKSSITGFIDRIDEWAHALVAGGWPIEKNKDGNYTAGDLYRAAEDLFIEAGEIREQWALTLRSAHFVEHMKKMERTLDAWKPRTDINMEEARALLGLSELPGAD